MRERLERLDPFVKQVEKKIDQLGIKGVLIDLDDHFLATTEFVRHHLGIFVEEVARITGLSYEEAWELQRKHSEAAFELFHVSPERWGYVVEEMSRELGWPASQFREAHEELVGMYGKSPEMIPGGWTTLKLMKEVLKLRVVWETNANVAWTLAKFDRLGLWRYTDNLVIVDERETKSVSHWREGVTLSQLPPAMLLGGGDSREADFAPLTEIGVRGIIGVPPQFEKARNGHQPEGVVMINSIAEWGEGVLRLN